MSENIIATAAIVALFIAALISLPTTSVTATKNITLTDEYMQFKGNDSVNGSVYISMQPYALIYEDHQEIYVPFILNATIPSIADLYIQLPNESNVQSDFPILNVSYYVVEAQDNSTPGEYILELTPLNASNSNETLYSNSSYPTHWYVLEIDTYSFISGSFNFTLYENNSNTSFFLDPPVSGCGTIPNGGNYYMIQNASTTISCLTIMKNNTNLNCQNQKIAGNGSSNLGVNIKATGNVSLNNCNIQNFQHGIRINNLTNSNFANVSISNTNFGLELAGTSDFNTFTNTLISNVNGTGIYFNFTVGANAFNGLNLTNMTTYTDFFGIGFASMTDVSFSATSQGKIIYPILGLGTATQIAEGVNIYAQPDFASVNPALNPDLNNFATVHLQTGYGCNWRNIKYQSGFPNNAQDIILNGTDYGLAACDGDDVSFNVSSWSGYTVFGGNGTYTVNFTDPNGNINISCGQPYVNSSQPEYQDTFTPSVILSNIFNRTIYNMTLALNSSIVLPSGNFTLWAYNSGYRPAYQSQDWSSTSNGIVYIPRLINTTPSVVVRRLRANESVGVWFWGDCQNVTDNQSISANFSWTGGRS
jgi:hypothetical protein